MLSTLSHSKTDSELAIARTGDVPRLSQNCCGTATQSGQLGIIGISDLLYWYMRYIDKFICPDKGGEKLAILPKNSTGTQISLKCGK